MMSVLKTKGQERMPPSTGSKIFPFLALEMDGYYILESLIALYLHTEKKLMNNFLLSFCFRRLIDR